MQTHYRDSMVLELVEMGDDEEYRLGVGVDEDGN
jgi:hypothetical protein